MDGPRGYHAKWNKSDRERQILYDFTYMWNFKNKTNEQTLQNLNRVMHAENKQVVAREGGMGNQKYKLPVIR